MKHNTDSKPPSGGNSRLPVTPPQTIPLLRMNMNNSRVPRLACILYLLACCTIHAAAQVGAVCVINLCMEKSGVIAVYLTDTTPACASNAANYLVSKCGVDYKATTCNVDCGSIYSWYGAYWHAMGCSTLGNPCGSQGECPSSVANVCQTASTLGLIAPSPTPGPPPTSALV
jgi:hypothetical protein